MSRPSAETTETAAPVCWASSTAASASHGWSAPAFAATTMRSMFARLSERGPAPNAGSVRLSSVGLPPFKLDSVYSPDRRSARGDRRDRQERRRGQPLHDAARRHRHRQDDDDGGHDRAAAEAVADPRPQQDARRAALQRVPHLLPAERRRVLRLLLRLLPARGLRPLARPLHREGLGDQPGDRPAAPRRDRRAVRAPRRADRRLGVGDLRPRLAGHLQRQPADADQGRLRRPRRAAAQARLPPVQPQRHRARPRHVPRPRRHAGDLPRLRRDRLPGDPVRRRGRAPPALRPADRRADRRRPRARRDLAGDALQRQGGHDGALGGRDRPRAQPSHRRAGGRGQAARGPPPAPAHAVRHGDAARGRVLLRHRELLAHPRRPRARARAPTA